MLDRLAELRRQRALIAEHLAWLDGEIARTAPAHAPGVPAPAPSAAGAACPAAAPASATPEIPEPPAIPDPAKILAALNAGETDAAPNPTAAVGVEPRLMDAVPVPGVEQRDVQAETRKGCLLYFFGAIAATALGIWLLVLAAHSEWMQREAGPYLAKATLVALIVGLAAAIRKRIAKSRSD